MIIKEFAKHKSSLDIYWQQIKSISLTPIAKSGLGKLFTFDFVSPCFEKVDEPNLSKAERIKRQSLSLYGEIRFDFR